MDLETLRLKYEVTGLAEAKRGVEDLSRRAAIGLGRVAEAFRKGERGAAAFAGTAVPALEKVVHATDRLDTALAGLHERVGRLDGRRVGITVDLRPDAGVLAAQLRELDTLTRRLDKRRLNLRVDFSPALARVGTDLRDLDKVVSRIDGRTVRVRFAFTPSLAKVLVDLGAVQRKLHAIAGRYTVTVNVRGLAGARAQLDGLSAQLMALRALDGPREASTGGGFLSGLLGGAVSGVRSLFGAGTALAGLTGRVTALTSGLTVAAAGALGLGEALAGLAGGAAVGALAGLSAAALGLGSALAVAGGGLAAFALFAAPAISAVTTGVQAYEKAQKAAQQALAEGDVRGYTKALADQRAALAALTPAQRATVGGFEQLKGAFLGYSRALEPSVLGTVNRAFALAGTLLPQLVPVASAVSTALGGVFTTAQRFLTGGVFTGLLADVTREAGPLITQFAGIGTHLVGAFANALHAGLPLIDTVMGQLGGLAASVESAFASDGFKKFVSFGVQVLPQLAGLLRDAAHAVGDLASGLAPLAPVALGIIDKLVKGLDAAFTGPGMGQFVATVQQLLPVVGQALGQVAGAAGALMSALAPLAPVVIGVVGKLAGALAAAFSSPAAQQFIASLAADLPRLVPVLSVVADTVVKVGGALLDGLGPALDALQPGLEAAGKFVGVFAGALGELLPPLAQGLSALVDGGLADALTGLVQALAPALGKLLPVLGSSLGRVFEALVPAFERIGDFLSSDALTKGVSAFADLLVAIAPVAGSALPLMSAALSALVPAMQALAPGISAVADTFLKLVTDPSLLDTVGALAPLFLQIAQSVSQLLPPLTSLLQNLILPMLPGIADLTHTMVEQFVPALQQVTDWAKAILPLLEPVVDFLQGNLIDKLKSAADVAIGLGQALSGAFDPSQWSGALTALVDGIGGAFDSIGGGINDVLQWFIDLPGKIAGLFASAGDWLYNAGSDLLSGLMRGMVDHIPLLGGLLGDITQFVADHKGPPSKDRTLLVPAGRLIMGSLSDGLTAGLPGVKATLAAVTATVADTGPYTAGTAHIGLGTVAAAAAPAAALAAAGASGGNRTVTFKGDYTINDKTAETAAPGSVEATVHSILAEHIAALNADAGAPF